MVCRSDRDAGDDARIHGRPTLAGGEARPLSIAIGAISFPSMLKSSPGINSLGMAHVTIGANVSVRLVPLKFGLGRVPAPRSKRFRRCRLEERPSPRAPEVRVFRCQGPRPCFGAGEGNRTPVASLEGWCSTIELHPRAGHPLRATCRRGNPARFRAGKPARNMEGAGFEPA